MPRPPLLLSARPRGEVLGQVPDDPVGSDAPFAGRVAKAAWACIVLPIEDHVVVVLWARSHWNGIEMEFVANLPRDDMVGAGSVAAQPEATDDLSVRGIQGQPAAKHDDAANGFADHWIILSTKCGRVPECRLWVGRLTRGERIEALARLRSGVDVGGRDCIIPAAEAVGCVGL